MLPAIEFDDATGRDFSACSGAIIDGEREIVGGAAAIKNNVVVALAVAHVKEALITADGCWIDP